MSTLIGLLIIIALIVIFSKAIGIIIILGSIGLLIYAFSNKNSSAIVTLGAFLISSALIFFIGIPMAFPKTDKTNNNISKNNATKTVQQKDAYNKQESPPAIPADSNTSKEEDGTLDLDNEIQSDDKDEYQEGPQSKDTESLDNSNPSEPESNIIVDTADDISNDNDKDPIITNPEPIESDYLANSNTGKFHESYCSHAKKISSGNRVEFSSRDNAINNGYVACKVCKP